MFSDGRPQSFRRRFLSIPFFELMPLLAAPPCLVFDRLRLKVLEGRIDRRNHISSLRQPDERPVARTYRDLGSVAVLFQSQDDLRIKLIAEDLADLGEASFNFFADSGSDFILSPGVFHVHEVPPREI